MSTGPVSDEQEGVHEAARRAKLRRIQELGHDPWGARFDGHAGIAEIRARDA